MKLFASILAATLLQETGAQDSGTDDSGTQGECADDGTAFTVTCHNDLLIELIGTSFIQSPLFKIFFS